MESVGFNILLIGMFVVGDNKWIDCVGLNILLVGKN